MPHLCSNLLRLPWCLLVAPQGARAPTLKTTLTVILFLWTLQEGKALSENLKSCLGLCIYFSREERCSSTYKMIIIILSSSTRAKLLCSSACSGNLHTEPRYTGGLPPNKLTDEPYVTLQLRRYNNNKNDE